MHERSREIYFMNDERRRRLREDPTIVLNHSDGRKISLVLEQDQGLHLAFGLIEQEGRGPRERAASGDTEEMAVKGIGQDIYQLYLREGHDDTVENMHRTGRVPRRYRIFKADAF